jgi:hypothetical protein
VIAAPFRFSGQDLPAIFRGASAIAGAAFAFRHDLRLIAK